ncbi:MAG: DUF502 domain-containing protein [Spirochaetales bacterium]|nr:DUF502 domain-containing protein [Spirochaetales bacterium]
MKIKKKIHVLSALRNQFTAGFVSVVPITLSIFLLYQAFILLDNIIGRYFKRFFGFYYVGIGIGILLLIIWVAGLITSSYFGSKLVQFQDYIITKIPVLGTIFKTIKQVSHSILSDTKGSFSQVVMLEVFHKGYYSIGFITNDKKVPIGENKSGFVHVYVPTSPNPTSGFIMLVEKKKLIKLDIPLEEAFKVIISAGMVIPNRYK